MRLAAALALFALLPGAAAAQDVRAVRVEYIAGRNLYLTGPDGVAAGDTLRVRRSAGGPERGAFRVIATARERVVVTFAGAPFAVTRGDSLWVTSAPGPAPAAPPAEPDPALRPPPAQPAAVRRPSTPLPRRMRASGRVSVDMDALSSHDDRALADRSLFTPAVRVNALARGLPGGLSGEVSLRYAHPQGTGLFAPAPSLRIYRAALETGSYDAPLRLRLGRFVNEHDPYAGYWDGLLLRAGTRRAGIGIVAGFEPDLGNQGFSRLTRKYGAFADAAVRRGRFGWTLDVAAVTRDGTDGLRPERALSAAQTLRFGGLRTRQRIQVTHERAAPWSVAQAEIDATLLVAGPLSLRGFASERRYGWAQSDSLAERPRRRTAGAGVLVSAPFATLLADVTRTTWRDAAPTTSWAGLLFVPESTLGVGLGASVTAASEPGRQTLLVAPRLSRTFGRTRASAGWERYTIRSGDTELRTTGFDVSLAVPLNDRFDADVRLRTRRGADLATDRAWVTLSMRF